MSRLLPGLLIMCSGCVSMWQQRDHQDVVWSDGGQETVEVWLGQGSTMVGQPFTLLLDVLVTPVMWFAESSFALAAMSADDRAIAGGPFGYLLSLLPVFTCVPLDAHPSAWLHLRESMPLPAAEREVLRGLGDAGGVAWLARHYEQKWAKVNPHLAGNVHRWVVAVRLGPPRPPIRPPTGS